MRKEYLMTPGPTPVPPSVLAAGALPMIHHRTPNYSQIFAEVNEDLKYVMRTNNDVLSFASSGTGAMESAVVNLFSAGEKVIVASNGKFGDRFSQIGNVYGLNVIDLKYEWGQVVNPVDLENALSENPDVKGVFITQSETSTGVLNDVEKIASAVKKHDVLLVVDSITGLGAVDIKPDDWGLDVVMSGSQKGLMMPPGLSCVSVSDKAWAAVERSNLPKFYFSYAKARKALAGKSPTTPFTPAVSLVISLGVALKIMREEGIENIIERHSKLATAARNGLEALGLKLFAPPEGRGNAVTPAYPPEGISATDIVKNMKSSHGITIADGQDHLKGKVFRIGHLGYYDKFDILTTLAGLELTLRELGYDFTLGAGVGAAEKVFAD